MGLPDFLISAWQWCLGAVGAWHQAEDSARGRARLGDQDDGERRQGRIDDEIMNLVQRDLDLEDARLDV